MKTDLVDSHCHLDMLAGWRGEEPLPLATALAEQAEIVERARVAGVTQMVTPGCAWQDFDGIRALPDRFDNVWIGFGIHPHDASTWDDAGSARLAREFQHPRAVAVGECGLDYHYDMSSREEQRAAFRAQIRLARELGKPLIIHTREAEEDTLALMKEENAAEFGGVMHCFTSSLDLAKACLDLGFYVSFSGIVAFPKSGELREVAGQVPLDRTLAETDAPYLAPPPYRGRRNEPAFVVRVIETLATVHGVTADEAGLVTALNARKLFRLPMPL